MSHRCGSPLFSDRISYHYASTMRRPKALKAHSNIDTRQAAEQLGMSRRTLEKWRVEGNGPPFLKLGRRVLYSVADLEAWIRSHRRRSTSEG